MTPPTTPPPPPERTESADAATQASPTDQANPIDPDNRADQVDRVTRAPSDVLRLVVAVSTLVVVAALSWFFDDAIVAFVADLFRGFDALPEWLTTALVITGQVLGAALIVASIVRALQARSWWLMGSCAVAAGLAALLLQLVRPFADETGAEITEVNESLIVIDPGSLASITGLAVVAAIVTVASPWVSRRRRQAGWALVVFLTVQHFLGAPVNMETLLAVLVGWAAGAATVVALGAPTRRPSATSIAAGMAAVGVPLVRLEAASVDARGSTPYFATAEDGTELFVKALGADERSADLLFRVFRRIQPHDLGDERAYSSLRRAVEHEALLSLLARDLGVRTPHLFAVAAAEPNGYALAYEAIAGRSLDRLDAEEFTPELLRAVWDQLALLRVRRIAHRDLRLANVFLADDGEIWIIDFGFSEVAASDLLLANDLAELLASSASQVGAERAAGVAREVIGDQVLTCALDRLHLPMLSGATRAAMKAEPGLLDELRSQIAGSTTSITTATSTRQPTN